LFYRKLLYVIILSSLAFSQYEYNLEDVNPNSATFGENVWHPVFSDYITLHYFGTQGWQGWTSIFWQLSDFQELLHEAGYEKVVIIGIGKDFLQDSFGESFYENSSLPLVLDSSPDYINFAIHGQFDATWKEIFILNTNGSLLDRILMDFDSIEPYQDQMYDLIVQNYSSVTGDVNADGTINILDIVLIVNLILSGEYQESADLNSDGNLNILDIVQLVNIILGGWLFETIVIIYIIYFNYYCRK